MSTDEIPKTSVLPSTAKYVVYSASIDKKTAMQKVKIEEWSTNQEDANLALELIAEAEFLTRCSTYESKPLGPHTKVTNSIFDGSCPGVVYCNSYDQVEEQQPALEQWPHKYFVVVVGSSDTTTTTALYRRSSKLTTQNFPKQILMWGVQQCKLCMPEQLRRPTAITEHFDEIDRNTDRFLAAGNNTNTNTNTNTDNAAPAIFSSPPKHADTESNSESESD